MVREKRKKERKSNKKDEAMEKPKDICHSALENGCLWECWPGGARTSEVSKEAENLAFLMKSPNNQNIFTNLLLMYKHYEV